MFASFVSVEAEGNNLNTVSLIKNASSTMTNDIRAVLEPIVLKETQKYMFLDESFTAYKELVLAIIMQESSGDYKNTPDVMQSSESKGLSPNSFQTPEESIEQGVFYLYTIFKMGIELGMKDTNNDIKVYIQSYNFGVGFLTYYVQNEALTLDECIKEFVVSKGGKYGDSEYIKHVLSFLNYSESTGEFAKPLNQGNQITERFGTVENPTGYGSRFHKGIDIGCQTNEVVYASQDGQVLMAQYNGAYGNYILLKHGEDTETAYAHLNGYNVSAEQSVKQGDVIGYCGSTGWSTGNHLHYEVHINKEFVNPETYFDYTRSDIVTPDNYTG